MSKVYQTSSLGYKLNFNGPESVEAYDQAAGKVGACLEDGVFNTIYRGTLPEWQDKFAEELEKLTGEKRAVNEKLTTAAKARSKTPEKVKDVMETVLVYHNRITANMSNEDKAELAKMAQTVADSVTVDPSPSARAAGIPKEYRDRADSMLTLPTADLEAKISTWGDKYESVDISSIERDEEGKPTKESLARVIRSVIEAKLLED